MDVFVFFASEPWPDADTNVTLDDALELWRMPLTSHSVLLWNEPGFGIE